MKPNARNNRDLDIVVDWKVARQGPNGETTYEDGERMEYKM